MKRLYGRALAAGGLAAGVALGLAGPASAHVTLHATNAVQGGSDTIISVRVPNEEDNATTTQVEVDFPVSAPMLNMLVQPTPGWTFQVTDTTLPKPITTDDGSFSQVVTKVVWSGGNIPVGGYQDFNLDVSTLPSVPSVEVKAVQTYSNGDIVRWIDAPAAAGQPMPDHPAPTLALAPAAGDNAAPAATAAPPAAAAPAPTVSLNGVAKTSDVNGTRTLSVIALVVGIVGLLAGAGGAVIFRRRKTASAALQDTASVAADRNGSTRDRVEVGQ
jgi:uncharacterized protein YcnI